MSRPRTKLRAGSCAVFGWAQVRRRSPFVEHVGNCGSYWLEPTSLTDRRPVALHIGGIAVAVDRGLLSCPRCARRLWKLYKTSGGRLGCFKCLNISYAVQSATRGDSLLSAIERIDAKLVRPIHAPTRERLLARRAALYARRALLFASSPSVLKYLETDSISVDGPSKPSEQSTAYGDDSIPCKYGVSNLGGNGP
jgi:hypothetical protein